VRIGGELPRRLRVIEGVDLPAIIRESTNSMTAEVMTDVRTQGERADDVVVLGVIALVVVTMRLWAFAKEPFG
jgi:hypothetical protein